MKATIYHVARRARVSTATVSRFLNGTGLVAAETGHRIEQAIQVLGYRPNMVARSLVTKATHTLALLMPDITNPFFPDLVKGVQLLADERGYTVLLCSVAGDAAREEEYLQMLSAKQVDGALLVGLVSGRGDDRSLRQARNSYRFPGPQHRLPGGAARPGQSPQGRPGRHRAPPRAWPPPRRPRLGTDRAAREP